MMDATEFVQEFTDKKNNISVKKATVDLAYSEGKPKLLFDGEASISRKGYDHLDSFTPSGGERVLVINDVIIGRIKQY